MLRPEEIKEIDEEIDRVPDRRAACIGALKAVQHNRRWVSDEALADLAEHLGMSTAELDDVATFYNLVFRHPVGRHIVLMCDSVSCWVLGCSTLRRRIAEELGVGLGETTADGRFTFLPVACLGACERAPALMVDDDLHGNVDPDHVAELLEEYD